MEITKQLEIDGQHEQMHGRYLSGCGAATPGS